MWGQGQVLLEMAAIAFPHCVPWESSVEMLKTPGEPVVRDCGSLFPQDRLEHLRKQCGPHVSAAAKDSVEGICSKIYYISLEYVKRIREKHLAILKENNISGTQPALESCRATALHLKASWSGLSLFRECYLLGRQLCLQKSQSLYSKVRNSQSSISLSFQSQCLCSDKLSSLRCCDQL